MARTLCVVRITSNNNSRIQEVGPRWKVCFCDHSNSSSPTVPTIIATIGEQTSPRCLVTGGSNSRILRRIATGLFDRINRVSSNNHSTTSRGKTSNSRILIEAKVKAKMGSDNTPTRDRVETNSNSNTTKCKGRDSLKATCFRLCETRFLQIQHLPGVGSNRQIPLRLCDEILCPTRIENNPHQLVGGRPLVQRYKKRT